MIGLQPASQRPGHAIETPPFFSLFDWQCPEREVEQLLLAKAARLAPCHRSACIWPDGPDLSIPWANKRATEIDGDQMALISSCTIWLWKLRRPVDPFRSSSSSCCIDDRHPSCLCRRSLFPRTRIESSRQVAACSHTRSVSILRLHRCRGYVRSLTKMMKNWSRQIFIARMNCARTYGHIRCGILIIISSPNNLISMSTTSYPWFFFLYMCVRALYYYYVYSIYPSCVCN